MSLSPLTLGVIAVGGAAGAVMRHLVGHVAVSVMGPGFPWGTLAVNLLGSILMGVVIQASAVVWSPPPEIRALIVTGFLGAFTTFSTFSLDTVTLMTSHHWTAGIHYVLASVVLGVTGLYLGMMITKALAA